MYSDKEWAEILRGPEPFTPEEKALLDARRRIHWRELGIDESGKRIIEVTNNSSSVLPALTLGVRSKNGHLNGAIRLLVQTLLPGRTTTLHVDCYKNLVSPEDVELFDLPDPQPEDRELFWEFGKK